MCGSIHRYPPCSLCDVWRTQLWKISILWIGGEMYDDANKSHHDVADIKTFKVFFLSSQVKRLSNTLVKSTHCRWTVNAVVTARCPNPMERLRLVITMNGADGDQRAGYWLMMLRLMMIGIFPAIKMMMVLSTMNSSSTWGRQRRVTLRRIL